MADRFNFDEGRIGFHYNADPQCREDRGLERDKKYIVIYNGENSIPYILEFEKDHIDLRRLMYEVTVWGVKGTPRWGQRAHSAVFDFFSNALIFMIPDAMSPEEMQKDWRVMLMVRMIEMIQEHETSFVPLIVPFL